MGMVSQIHKEIIDELSEICAFCKNHEPRIPEGEEDNGFVMPFCKVKNEFVDSMDSCKKFESDGNNWDRVL